MAKDEILMGGLGDKLMCLLATYSVVPFGYARMGPDHGPIPVAKIWGVRGMKDLCDSGATEDIIGYGQGPWPGHLEERLRRTNTYSVQRPLSVLRPPKLSAPVLSFPKGTASRHFVAW